MNKKHNEAVHLVIQLSNFQAEHIEYSKNFSILNKQYNKLLVERALNSLVCSNINLGESDRR